MLARQRFHIPGEKLKLSRNGVFILLAYLLMQVLAGMTRDSALLTNRKDLLAVLDLAWIAASPKWLS